jgi:glycosyltransferase involved in cell wall biosynthesis
MNKISVSIIIPFFNEEKHISKCLDSIIKNDYPKNLLEIILINGNSEDNTVKKIQEYQKKVPYIFLKQNPKREIPISLNIGIKAAQNDCIIRLDAHSHYPSNYVSLCTKYLKEYQKEKVANVGGVLIVEPGANTKFARAIANIYSSSFGVGNSTFRTGNLESPKFVDTVPFGTYYKKLFDEIGLYNEDIPRSEDIDLSKRIIEKGYKLLLVPEIKVYYHARSDFFDFCRHTFINGYHVTFPLNKGRMLFELRHLIPCFFAFFILLSIATIKIDLLCYLSLSIYTLYFSLTGYFSYKVKNNTHLFFYNSFTFFLYHCTYGFGSVWGLYEALIIRIKRLKNG